MWASRCSVLITAAHTRVGEVGARGGGGGTLASLSERTRMHSVSLPVLGAGDVQSLGRLLDGSVAFGGVVLWLPESVLSSYLTVRVWLAREEDVLLLT